MNKKIISIIIGIIIIAGIIGGVWWYRQKLAETSMEDIPSANERGKCGDGVCDEIENKREICPKDCGTIVETESCGPNNNGYCINFREECKEGYEGIGPNTCIKGKSAECCIPIDIMKVSSELSYSFGIHPSSFNGYSYAKDLGMDFNREGVYFIWDWSDINRDGNFKFKKATTPQRPDQPNSGDFINYDDEQEKLSSVANIKLIRNVCPFGKRNLFGDNFRGSSKEKIYQEYVEKLVERYDGDSDLGCTQNAPDCYKPGDNEYPSQSLIDVLQMNPIQYWQVCNQVTDTCFEKDCKDNNKYAEKYAKTLELTYIAIKKSCPECQVLIAGDSSKDMYPSVYQALNGKYVDIIDKHFFGRENDYVKIQEEMTYLKDSLKDNGFDLKKLRFWITETGTYSGDPVDDRNNFPEGLPYQSETQQAQGLIKIYATAFGEGIEKVLWAWGLNEGFRCECCIFDYTGLIYDGNREKQMCNSNDPYDLGKDVKKLSYYSYKLMTDKIKGFTSVETIQESNGIYVYKFNKQGKSIWIAWSENPGSKSVNIDVNSDESVRITEAVPKFETGNEVIDYNNAFRTVEELPKNREIILTLKDIPLFIEETKN